MTIMYCRNHSAIPAVAGIDWNYGSPPPTEGLCAECAMCTNPGCPDTGDILDSEYCEPWCNKHAAQFRGEEAVSGPALIPV